MALVKLFFFLIVLHFGGNYVEANPNYMDALAKSLLFFQGQRSGRLPNSQLVRWRSDSALTDGQLQHVCYVFTSNDICCDKIFLYIKVLTICKIRYSLIRLFQLFYSQIFFVHKTYSSSKRYP